VERNSLTTPEAPPSAADRQQTNSLPCSSGQPGLDDQPEAFKAANDRQPRGSLVQRRPLHG